MSDARSSEVQRVCAFREDHRHGEQAQYSTIQDRKIEATPRKRAWLATRLSKARPLLRLQAADRFLDLGCGEGRISLPLACEAGQTCALDFTGTALRLQRDQMVPQLRPVHLGLATAEYLVVFRSSFDKFLGNHMLERAPYDGVPVEVLKRLVWPGGRLLVSIGLALAPQARVSVRLCHLVIPTAPHPQLESVTPEDLVLALIGRQSQIWFCSLCSLCTLLARHGFRILHVEGLGLAVRGPDISGLARNPVLLYLGPDVGRIVPTLGNRVVLLLKRP